MPHYGGTKTGAGGGLLGCVVFLTLGIWMAAALVAALVVVTIGALVGAAVVLVLIVGKLLWGACVSARGSVK